MRTRVSRWRPAVTRLGRIRQWLWHRVFWYECETCDRCGGRVNRTWWCVDPQIWSRAYLAACGVIRRAPELEGDGRQGTRGLLCTKCFERHTGESIEWLAVALRNQNPDPVETLLLAQHKEQTP